MTSRLLTRGAAGLAIAAALALAPAAQANLITNPGFESAPPAPIGGFSLILAPAGPTGWTGGGHDVLLINTNYVEGAIKFTAHGGNQHIDITGAGNTGLNTLSQTIATVAGTLYDVSFYVGVTGTSNLYNTASSIDLLVDNVLVTTGTNSNVPATGAPTNWQLVTAQFTATGASTVITFRNATPTVANGGNNYAGLDDVSVTAALAPNPVPEPASLLLVGLGGLTACGVRLRRRQAAAV